jgi:hypothetical protein
MAEESFIFEQKIRKQHSVDAYYTYIDLYDENNNLEHLDENSNARVSEDSKKVLARKIQRDDGSVKYSIKLDNSARLFNPGSIFNTDKHANFLDTVCRRSNKFKDVSEKTFSMYLKFLKTKNVAYLHNAEREMM